MAGSIRGRTISLKPGAINFGGTEARRTPWLKKQNMAKHHIDKLRATISELEKEREEFKRLYHEAEQKVKDLSESQAAAQKTIRLSKLIEPSS